MYPVGEELITRLHQKHAPQCNYEYWDLSEGDFVITFLTDIAEAVQTKGSTNKIRIYPNPTNSILHIEVDERPHGKFNIEIVNLEGRTLYQNSNYIEQIGIANFPSGIYFIRVNIDQNVMVEKVVIQ
jgi:hypothetical protein